MRATCNAVVMVGLAVVVFVTAAKTYGQGTGKDLMIRGSIADVAAAKTDEQKKGGLVGWIYLKEQTGPGLRIFVKDKTKLEQIVGKERKAATFADLKKGDTVEITYVLHDGQPSAGPTLADAKQVVILANAK